MSITGDVTLDPDKMTLGKKTFPLIVVRRIEEQNLDNAAKLVDFLQTPSSARLYKALVSRHTRLLNRNTICGPDADGRWMLAVFGKQRRAIVSILFWRRRA